MIGCDVESTVMSDENEDPKSINPVIIFKDIQANHGAIQT